MKEKLTISGHTKVVSTLIRNGAKVNQSNAVGNTALILASDKGFVSFKTQIL